MIKLSVSPEWTLIFTQALLREHIDFRLICTGGEVSIEVKNRDFKQTCEAIEYARVMNTKGV